MRVKYLALLVVQWTPSVILLVPVLGDKLGLMKDQFLPFCSSPGSHLGGRNSC